MANLGRTVTIEMEEYRELMMLKGKFISLEEYVKNTKYVEKNIVLAILGIQEKKEENNARTN